MSTYVPELKTKAVNIVFDDLTSTHATNFNGTLLNNGGGNSGTISFDFVDPDGDGRGSAMTIP